MLVKLLPIPPSGIVKSSDPSPGEHVAWSIDATQKLYSRVGHEPPWIGYLAFDGGTCVGTCGFTSPPRGDRVEIAYFTFPGHESRGIATQMASELIRIAHELSPDLGVIAHTLPEQNASTAVLRKLGFTLNGPIEHPVDGTVWEWRRAKQSATFVT